MLEKMEGQRKAAGWCLRQCGNSCHQTDGHAVPVWGRAVSRSRPGLGVCFLGLLGSCICLLISAILCVVKSNSLICLSYSLKATWNTL